MKLYVIFLLAVVNGGTSSDQPTEGMSCEMVRLSLYSDPLRSWVKLGSPCHRHCTSNYGLWEGNRPQDQDLCDGRGGLCWVSGCSAGCSQTVAVGTAHKKNEVEEWWKKGHNLCFFLNGAGLKKFDPISPRLHRDSVTETERELSLELTPLYHVYILCALNKASLVKYVCTSHFTTTGRLASALTQHCCQRSGTWLLVVVKEVTNLLAPIQNLILELLQAPGTIL